jgi:hypothetical protein
MALSPVTPISAYIYHEIVKFNVPLKIIIRVGKIEISRGRICVLYIWTGGQNRTSQVVQRFHT